jgi:hypothetical protein
VGIESQAEFFEVDCWGLPDPKEVCERLSLLLPQGLFILDAERLAPGAARIGEDVEYVDYTVLFSPDHNADSIADSAQEFEQRESRWVSLARKRGIRYLDSKHTVVGLNQNGQEVSIRLRWALHGSLKVSEAVASVFGMERLRGARIRKERVIFGTPCADVPKTPPQDSDVLDLQGLNMKHVAPERPRTKRTRAETITTPYQE